MANGCLKLSRFEMPRFEVKFANTSWHSHKKSDQIFWILSCSLFFVSHKNC